MPLFRNKKTDYASRTVSNLIDCISGDRIYVMKSTSHFVITLMSQRGTVMGSATLDYDNIKQMMWLFGTLPAPEYAPQEQVTGPSKI